MGSAELTKNGPFVLLLGWRPSALNRFLLLQNRFHFQIVGFLSYVLWVLSVCWTCWSLRPLQLGFQFVPTIKHFNEIEVGVVSHNQNCRLNSVFKSETSFCWLALFIVLPCPKKRQHEDSCACQACLFSTLTSTFPWMVVCPPLELIPVKHWGGWDTSWQWAHWLTR